MRHILAAGFLLALPVSLPAGAQEMRSGPNAPATSSQVPPGETPDVPRTGEAGASRPAESRDTPARRGPQPGNPSVNAPAVPGARQPEHSTGMSGGRHDMPERPGARPDASTTGR
jgi:hypothetical protein